MVLLIIALLATASLPAMQSAFVEQNLRKDAHQLSIMVRTAMLRSSEQNRPYAIEVTAGSVSLHPFAAATPDAASPTGDAPVASSGSEDVNASNGFDPANKLLTLDPKKAHAWIDMPPTTWLFQPGDLCPVPRVRLTRGNAWLELSFNALTGDVEDETAEFP